MKQNMQSEYLRKEKNQMFRVRFFGMMFLISGLICGGGIDAGKAWQTVLGLVLCLVAAGELYCEAMKNAEFDFDNNSKHHSKH